MTSGTERGSVPFATALATFGDRPALVTDDVVVSYADLAALVEDRRRLLGETRRLVLLAGGNDVATVATYLAALAGGHPVLLAPDRPEVLDSLSAAYDPDVVVRGGALTERRAGSAHDLHPSLALLLSTSGSTGSPRLVRLSGENLQANAESIAAYLPIRGSDVAVTTLPLHYCYGLSVLHTHLLRGAAVVLTSLSVVDPCFWELVRRRGVTSLSGVPHTFDLLDRVGFADLDLPSLRYLTQAGGRMAPEQVRRYAELGQRRGFDLFVMYGQTEATARMAYLPADLAREHPGAVGVPVPGGSLRLDPTPEDPTVGELVYEGPNVMLGYAASPADLALGRVATELRTGDLARRTGAGLFEVVGRTARFAKVLGLRIDLDRVERLLTEAGHRAWCATRDDLLVVAVEPRGDAGSGRLLDRVARTVAEVSGLPRTAVRVVAVEQVPLLPNGKPDRGAVGALAETSVAPEEPRGVGDVLAAVVGRHTVAPDDTFVSLGGDSLSYVEASVRLEALLGHLPAGWHLRTVAELERTRRDRRGRLRTVETSVLVRALAIVAIVGTHGNLFVLAGGAHLLLAVAGFNVARFHLTGAARGERCRRLLRSAARVAVPSVVWVGGVTLLTAAYPWQTALLLNGVAGPRSWAEPAWHLWFVEALVATLLGLAVLAAVPALDRAERRWPFAFPVVLAVAALASRYELVVLRGGDHIHRAHAVFWLVALGWAAARATTARQRMLVSALAVATVPGFFGDPAREAVVVVGLLVLLWVPHVRLPDAAARLSGVLAASSLWVYLTHWQVYPHLEDRYPLAAVLASFVVGVACWQAVPMAGRGVGRVLARRQRRAADGGAVRASSPASSTGRAPATTLTATGVPTG